MIQQYYNIIYYVFDIIKGKPLRQMRKMFNLKLLDLGLTKIFQIIMIKVFDLNLQQIHTHLKKTVSRHKCYRLAFEKEYPGKFTIYYPAKGIIITGTAIARDNTTELDFTATSPFCVISSEYEQILLTRLIGQLVSDLPPSARKP